MSEYVIHSIDLAELPSKDDIKFIKAEWWDDQSPLVVVVCRHRGELAKLRMDLDKRTFLDHLTDARGDKAVQSLSLPVWEIVAKQRFQAESAATERPYGY